MLSFYVQSMNDGMNKTENIKTRYVLLLKSGIKSFKSFRVVATTQLQVFVCIVLYFKVLSLEKFVHSLWIQKLSLQVKCC